jgi:hypothetical protein
MVIYHKVLERIAVKAGIVFDPPLIVRAEKDEAVIVVTGRMASKIEWATGEALLNANYKIKGSQSPYIWSMAEKRAKDRVILKLIELHGDIYSEDEADDLKQQFDAEATSKALIEEIDSLKSHDAIEALMKQKRVNDDLGKMSPQMSNHIRSYAKDTYRYLRSRAGVHGGNGRVQGARQEAAGGGFAQSGGGQPGGRFARQEAPQARQTASQMTRTEREEWATQTRPIDPGRGGGDGGGNEHTAQGGPGTQRRLPENAHDRVAEDGRRDPQHKTPDEILAALKDELRYCHTVDEVNATTDTYRAAIGTLTPPDISAANDIRKARIGEIEAEDRRRA